MTWRLAACVCALGASVLAGCGESNRQPDLVNGKKLFTGAGTCGSCHTLARAGTKATAGPNLDTAFEVARKDGFGKTAIEGVVRDQINIPRRDSAMPADLVTGNDRDDVAAYVAEVAGRSGKDTGALAAVGGNPYADKSTTAKAGKLVIPADPQSRLYFQFAKATAPPGPLTISMPNPSTIDHNIAIQGDGKGPVVGGGGDSTFKTTLKPGTYEYLCQVPGHEVTMKGTLTVK
jgi:mono/diheme cytochrome c family protein